MSSAQIRIILICVVVLAVGGAVVYGMYRISGGEDVGDIVIAERPDLPRSGGGEEGGDDKPFEQYRAITDRNVFKPLVVEASAAEGLTVPDVVPSPTGGGPSGPPPRPDPFANLAMTGVIERGKVRALITDTSTGQGRYVAEGEEAFGAKVLDIRAKKVRVQKEGQTKDLVLGENVPKEMPKTTAASGETAAPERRGPGPASGMSREEMIRRFRERGGREAMIRRMRERGMRFGC